MLLAHTSGIGVVAEGIETEAQLRLVKSLGCDFAQGYLFAHPARPHELSLPTAEPVAA